LLAWSLGAGGARSDNVLKPLVVSGRAQISTLPVFLGLMGGLSAFGAIGMVLGPVIRRAGDRAARLRRRSRQVDS